MARRPDEALQNEAVGLIDRARLPLAVEVNGGRVRITGAVDSQNEYQAALDLLKSIDGIEGIEDEIEITTSAPDSAFDDQTDGQGFEFAETPGTDEVADVEYAGDMTDDVGAGTSDFQEAVEEGEPYFPPTDPVVTPVDDDQELEITGGWQDTSMDELAEEPELDSDELEPAPPLADDRDDETIRDDILRELSEDALTTELDLEIDVIRGVAVLRGTVSSIDDAINAEDVARRVPGVRDVIEETTIDQ